MRKLIEELAAQVGKKTTVQGFIETIRNQGSIAFIELRDKTGLVQIVVPKEEITVLDALTVE